MTCSVEVLEVVGAALVLSDVGRSRRGVDMLDVAVVVGEGEEGGAGGSAVAVATLMAVVVSVAPLPIPLTTLILLVGAVLRMGKAVVERGLLSSFGDPEFRV